MARKFWTAQSADSGSEILLSDDSAGIASAQWRSTGKFEALELRDGDPTRYGGKGVLKVVANINDKIAKIINGLELNQKDFDQLLIEEDGTKIKVGWERTLFSPARWLSPAIAASRNQKALAVFAEISGTDKPALPTPMFNIWTRRHAVNSTDIQEFMIFNRRQKVLEKWNGGKNLSGIKNSEEKFTAIIGDEGGFAPLLFPMRQEIIMVRLIASSADKVKIAGRGRQWILKGGKYFLKR